MDSCGYAERAAQCNCKWFVNRNEGNSFSVVITSKGGLTLSTFSSYLRLHTLPRCKVCGLHRLYLYNEGNSEYYDIPLLYDRALKLDLVESDKKKSAVAKWYKFLGNWQSNKNFPKSGMLYQSESYFKTFVDDSVQSPGEVR